MAEVSLSYSTDGFFTSDLIAANITNAGSYTWYLPNITADCAQVLLINPNDPLDVRDTSGCFEITEATTPPALTLTAPTGGENWAMGSLRQITWSHAGNVPRVDLSYSTDGFATEHPIATAIRNTGHYTWSVPIAPTTFAQVRVVSTGNPTVQDTGNYFTIGCDSALEGNDEQVQACPLNFGVIYDASPDDTNDWYYVFLNQTAALHVLMTNYLADGQLVVYPYDASRTPPRGAPLANDGRPGHTRRELPNEILPHALDHLPGQDVGTGLPPGPYYIRIYTTNDYTTDLYHLTTTYQPVEP